MFLKSTALLFFECSGLMLVLTRLVVFFFLELVSVTHPGCESKRTVGTVVNVSEFSLYCCVDIDMSPKYFQSAPVSFYLHQISAGK